MARQEYLSLPTQAAKREYLQQYVDYETKGFKQFHGQHMTWQAMSLLFNASKNLIATVKRTDSSKFRDKTRINSVRGSSLMLNKEDIIVAFLKMIEQEFETSPTNQDTYIPVAFQRTLYSTFLEFWVEEVEGGPGGCTVLPPSESWFARVWKSRMPHLKCRAYHSFMMCDECVRINDKLRICRDPVEKAKYWEQRKTHMFCSEFE